MIKMETVPYPLETLIRLLEHDASKDVTVIFLAKDTRARESRDYHRCVLQSACKHLEKTLSMPEHHYGIRMELEDEETMRCAIDVFDSLYMGPAWILPTLETALKYRQVYGMLYMQREFNACTRAYAELKADEDTNEMRRVDIETRKFAGAFPRITRSMSDRQRRRLLRGS